MIIDSPNGIRPPQRNSYAAKIANDYAWARACIRYYVSISNFYVLGNNKTIYQRDVQMLYDVYNNNIKEEFFHYITNPLNSTQSQFKNFPARIRPYNIIRNNVDLFLGEFNKRYFNYQVVVEGDEGYNRYLESLNNELKANIEQHFINIMNEMGADTGLPSKKVVLPEEVEQYFKSNFRDKIAQQAAKWLDIFEKRECIKEKALDLCKDWIIAGESYSYKNIEHGIVAYDRVNPLYIDYDKSIDSKYIEDGAWATRLQIVTTSDIVDKFYDEFENANQIDNVDWSDGGFPAALINNKSNYNRENFKQKRYLYHANWIAQEKVGILTYLDPFTNQPNVKEVDETYKINKQLGDIELKWQWRNQAWEGYYLGGVSEREIKDNHDDKNVKQFFRIRPVPVQRHDIDLRSDTKLCYNGKRWSDTNSLNTSIVELSLPYQFLFIIIQYRIELAIAKSKMFALMDLNVIPNREGWNEEKTIYYADSIGVFYIDRNRVGVDKSFNQYQVVDLTMYQHITQLISIQDFIINRLDQLFGLTPQRKGQVSSSDTVGGTERSIVQSNVISDFTFTSFEQFLEKEYQGFIDLSKVENIEAKRTIFSNSDATTELLKIEPLEYCNSSLAIYATNSTLDRENLKNLKDLTQRLAQNPDVKVSTLAHIIKSNNYSEILDTIKEIEDKEMVAAQQMAANEQEAEAAKNELAMQFEGYRNMLELGRIDKEWDRRDQNTYIQGDIDITKDNATADVDNNGIPDINEIQKRAIDREKIYTQKDIERSKVAIEKQKLAVENKKIDKDFEARVYAADKSLEVAKENRTKAEMSKSKKKK